MPSRRCFFHPTYQQPLFGLPKSAELRKQWLQFIFRTVPEHYNPTISLCPKHFTKDSFHNLGAYNAGYSQKLLLKDGAVPTLSGHSDICESEPQHVIVQQTPAVDDVHSLYNTSETTENGVVEATGFFKEEDLDGCDNDSVASSVDTTTEEMFIDGLDPILDWPLHEIASPEEDQDSASDLHWIKRPRLSSTSAFRDEYSGRNGEECLSLRGVSTERWHGAEEADNEPSHSVFTPAQTPGLTFTSNSYSKPLKFFQMFFSNTLLEEIVTNTNDYGAKCQNTEMQWEQIDQKELESFIALVIFMGLFKCSSLANYWRDSEHFGLCFPQEIMSYQRFLSISNALYLSDSKEDEKNKTRKGTSEYERLGKIQPLYQVIREACKTFYHPFQNITIDERMLTSQAGTGLGKYTKNEWTSNEHKLFALSDCTDGYTWDFLVYEERSHPSQSMSYEAVMALVDENLLGTGYKLFVDQFYTSPTLFRDLLHKNIRACGPVNADRKGFPRTTGNSLPRNAARGTLRWIRDKELLFVRWKDAREIQMCSTFHKAYEGDTVKRKVRRGDRLRTFVNIPVPASVLDYDRNMEVVDPSNCVTGHFRLIHKPQKWYQCVFYHVLDIAIENAFILQKLTAKAKNRRASTRKAFLEMLILKLIAESPDPSSRTSSPTLTTRTPAGFSAPSSPASSSDPPSPPPASFHKPKHITQDGTASGRKCELCQQETTVMCVTCEVMLCFQPQRDCYNDWHEKQGL